MDDLFKPLEYQADPAARLEILHRIEADFLSRLTPVYERAAFDLKQQGWTVLQIADELKVPRERVKRLIGAYARRARLLNPLPSGRPEAVVDIRSLVRRATDPHSQ